MAAHLLWRYSCDSELATAFAEALQSFWEGRFGDAARAAYPLIEAGMRGLLLLLGKPLYRGLFTAFLKCALARGFTGRHAVCE